MKRARIVELVRGTVGAFLIKGLGGVLNLLMFAMIARALGPSDYGRLAVLFSLATLAAVVGSGGQRVNALRWAAHHDALGEARLRNGAVRFGYLIVLPGSIAAALIGHAVARSDASLVAVLCLTVALGVAELQAHVFRATGSVTLALAPRDILWRSMVIGLAFAAVAWRDHDASPVDWAIAIAGLLALSSAVQLTLHERRARLVFGGVAWSVRRWISSSYGLWATSVLLAASANVSVLLIDRTAGAADAGGFFAALRVSQIMALMVVSTKVVTLPLFARLVAQKRYRELERSAAIASILSLAFALLAFVAFSVYSDVLLGLFDPSYARFRPDLLVLSAGFVLAASVGPIEAVLQMTGNERTHALMLATTSGGSLLALPVAITVGDTVGAAVAIAASTGVFSIVAWAYVRVRVGLEVSFLGLILRGSKSA